MADTLTPAERSERMSRIRGRDTGPEKLVRSLLFRQGFRRPKLHRTHQRFRPMRVTIPRTN